MVFTLFASSTYLVSEQMNKLIETTTMGASYVKPFLVAAVSLAFFAFFSF